MSSRSVSVVLTAQVQNYLSNMRSAEQHTRDVERAARSATEQFRVHNEALQKVGVGMLAVGGAAALGLGVAIKASTEYGAKLAQLQSLSHASQGEMAALSNAAMKQGQAFGYSATQVADAEIELTKAGRSTAQMLGGDLKGALALAAAGQMDVAEATSIGVTAITQFASSGATIPHTADLLAAGADKALGSVQDLGMALKQGGLVSAQMGLSLDDTVGTLSAFAQAGLIGSDAGTSFKTMLLSLQSPSSQAEKYLQKYKITAYDSQGAFVGITNLAGQLQTKLRTLSQAQRDAALSTIFGSDAIRAANVLYTNGASVIAKWIHDVNDTGFASAQAAGKLNSLQGDLQKLSAAFETDMIKAGQSSDGFLRNSVQGITGLVGLLGDIPAPAQAAGVATTGVVAAVALVGGAALIAIPKINAARVAIGELGLTGRGVAGMIGKGSGLLIGIGAIVSGFAALGEHGTASVEQVKQAARDMEDGWGSIQKRFGGDGGFVSGAGLKTAIDAETNGNAGSTKFLDGLTMGITHFADVYKGNQATFDAMGQQLAGLAQQDYGTAAESFANLARSQHLTAEQTKTLLSQMGPYRSALADMARKAGVATDDQTLLNVAQGKGAASARVLAVSQALAANGGAQNAAAVQVLAGAADQATSSVKDLVAAIDGLDGGQLDARAAARAFEKALDDATAAVKKNGQTAIKHGTDLDISTEKGRANADALDAIASAAKASASAMTKAHAPAADVAKVLADGKKEYAATAHAMGLTWDAAHRLAEGLLGIPKIVQPKIALVGAGTALDKLSAFEAAVNKLNGTTAYVDTVYRQTGNPTGQARRAAGGSIDGPGAKGVDSVPALLAPGEHVLTTSDVDRMGGQGGVYAFRAALAGGGVQAYAKGGAVHKKKKAVHHSTTTHVPRSIRITDHSRLGEKHPHATISHPGAPKRKPSASSKFITDYFAKLYKKPKSVTFGGIYDQNKKAGQYKTQQATAQKALDHARSTLKRQESAAKAAQKALDKARDAAAAIHGKGTAAAKHAATMKVRRLTKANKTAADRVKATQKRITADTKTRDDAKDKRTAALAAAAALKLGQEDFKSAERRNPDRRTTDPLQYVDQLRQMSRDDMFSPTRRKAMDAAANKYEASLVNLAKSSEVATQKLTDLKAASVQLHDSIASAVSGGYRASAAGSMPVTSGWVTRNGMRFQQTSTGVSAGSLAGYYSKGAAAAKRFADDLAKLTKRGYPDALVAEVAGYGVEAGQPVITALLSASRSQQDQITRGYNSIGSSAGRAGTIVADDTYKAQIADASGKLDTITAQIKTDGEALRKLIARAFGLTGYATGTTSASGGIHWVGEDGPELVGFRGGEAVLNRADSARWVRGAGGAGGSDAQPVVVQVPAFPDTITVQDASGFRATMRVVAHEVVSARNDQLAVRLGAA